MALWSRSISFTLFLLYLNCIYTEFSAISLFMRFIMPTFFFSSVNTYCRSNTHDCIIDGMWVPILVSDQHNMPRSQDRPHASFYRFYSRVLYKLVLLRTKSSCWEVDCVMFVLESVTLATVISSMVSTIYKQDPKKVSIQASTFKARSTPLLNYIANLMREFLPIIGYWGRWMSTAMLFIRDNVYNLTVFAIRDDFLPAKVQINSMNLKGI